MSDAITEHDRAVEVLRRAVEAAEQRFNQERHEREIAVVVGRSSR